MKRVHFIIHFKYFYQNIWSYWSLVSSDLMKYDYNLEDIKLQFIIFINTVRNSLYDKRKVEMRFLKILFYRIFNFIFYFNPQLSKFG